jgi:5,6,7,8-tetrahydromethanopterin hydro-lyase
LADRKHTAMNDVVREQLSRIVARFGLGICDDTRRCQAVLRDLCGDNRREINVLIGALDERVVADLLASGVGVPPEVLIARFTKRLEESRGFAEDAARWAAESWAIALGVIAATDLNTIAFTCPNCGATGRVPIESKGKKGRCSKCKALVVISDHGANLVAPSKRQQGDGASLTLSGRLGGEEERVEVQGPKRGAGVSPRPATSAALIGRGRGVVGTGKEAAAVEVLLGSKEGPAGEAFLDAFISQGVGQSNLLAMLTPNLLCKPATLMVPKVALQGARHIVQVFGPAQYGIARAVSDSVATGIIPKALVEDCVCVCSLVVDRQARDDTKILNHNYEATCAAIMEAMRTAPHLDLKTIDGTRSFPVLQVGEALVGEGNEVAHIDLVVGTKTGLVGKAYAKALSNSDARHPCLTAELARGRPCKPDALLLTKVTLKSPRQNTQIFGAVRRAIAQAVEDCVKAGDIPGQLVAHLAILCAVFVHWEAANDERIYRFNYEATKLSIQRAMRSEPKIDEILAKKDTAKHPFVP